MTTALDRSQSHPGYWPSSWPVECGGNRRQKSSAGRLDAATGTARVTIRRDDKWHVMAIEREPGQWYVGSTMPAFTGPPPHGWVQRIDPDDAGTAQRRPRPNCRVAITSGAAPFSLMPMGSVMSVNGSFLHAGLIPTTCRSSASGGSPPSGATTGYSRWLTARWSRRISGSRARAARRSPDSIPTRFDPVGKPLTLSEGSMGRIAADVSHRRDGARLCSGTEHVWRLVVDGDRLVARRLATPISHRRRPVGPVLGRVMSDDSCWMMDCGDIESVRAHPHGPAQWSVRRYRPAPPCRGVDLRRGTGRSASRIRPRWRREHATRSNHSECPAATSSRPRVDVPEHGVAMAWDSVNGGLAGIDTTAGDLTVRLASRRTAVACNRGVSRVG